MLFLWGFLTGTVHTSARASMCLANPFAHKGRILKIQKSAYFSKDWLVEFGGTYSLSREALVLKARGLPRASGTAGDLPECIEDRTLQTQVVLLYQQETQKVA